MKPSQQELTILRMGQNGEGVAALDDGRVAFVSGALPGEQVTAEVTEVRKNFVRARTLRRHTSSPDREIPLCPVFESCGGCAFQHWAYASELKYKESRIKESLKRIGHFDQVAIAPIIGAQHPYNYRNKGQFPWAIGPDGRAMLGLFARGSHQVVEVQECAIQDGLTNRVLAAASKIANRMVLPVYQETADAGVLRHLLVRSSKDGKRALAALVVRRWDARVVAMAQHLMEAVPQLVGVVANLNPRQTNVVLGRETIPLAGESSLVDEILGQRFRLSASTFFQVNPEQVEPLYRTVQNAIQPGTARVWDLYAGVGTLACLVAPQVESVWAVEVNPESVDAARANAQLNGLKNLAVEAMPVEMALRKIHSSAPQPDAVIVDPPRSGLRQETLEGLVGLKARQMIYVSCNPNTLARDLEKLHDGGYRIEGVQPVDMFPRTDHVESVTVLRLPLLA